MTDSPPRRRPWQVPWVRKTLLLVTAGAMITGVWEVSRRLKVYSETKIEKKVQTLVAQGRVDLRIDFEQRPGWMDKPLVESILKEAQLFAEQSTVLPKSGQPGQSSEPVSNYFRLCNPLDDQVLADLARQFSEHAGERQNGWIKRITAVRRLPSQDGRRQTVRITAEFRKPVALLVLGSTYYLIDAEATRLPGEYTERDAHYMNGRVLPASSAALMTISGIDEAVPAVGVSWKSPDVHTALHLVALLADKPYVNQIRAVNVGNLNGRVDKLAAQITLETVFPDPANPGEFTKIRWGRPPGDEKFYEVAATIKLKALHDLYLRFHRIDAQRSYVDIRTEQIRLPRIQPREESAAASRPASIAVIPSSR